MRDNGGQVALEYLLIFTISLILLIVFTLPLSELTVKNTLDVSDTLDVKSYLSKIAQAVKKVYGQGQGSRQTVDIVSSKDIQVNVANNCVSCTLKLKDGSSKVEKIYFKSTLPKSTLYISKGENSIVIDWPIDSESMQIYSK
ncbi:MAG: hypothetical protein VZR10_09120 [Methanobrevibacter sp.]|nr:hypothetical protein [Methanobrevibacter sp.]